MEGRRGGDVSKNDENDTEAGVSERDNQLLFFFLASLGRLVV